MNKKVTILLMAIALVFSGCNKSQEGSSNSIEFENSNQEEISDSTKDEIEEVEEAIIDSVEENDVLEEVENTNNIHKNDIVTENTLEYDNIFLIPNDANELMNKDIKIINAYNSLILTWDNNTYDYFKLYASSTENGKYNLVKTLHKEVKDDTNLLPYSVSLENFEPSSRVYLRVTSVKIADGEVIEKTFGDAIFYESKAVVDFNSNELQSHLIKEYPVIITNDKSIGFRFYDRYIVEESSDTITITSNLKGEYVSIFDNLMDSEYKEEIIDNIKGIYEYIYNIKGKRVIGIVENKFTITINSLENISIDFK